MALELKGSGGYGESGREVLTPTLKGPREVREEVSGWQLLLVSSGDGC